MKKLKYLLAIFALLNCVALFSTTLNVPGDYSSIQKAINAAKTGDTVLVSPGRYFENINYYGKSIVVESKYALTKDTSFIMSTIIDGSKPVHADTASCVLMISSEGSGAVLDGFTITNGKGTPIKGYVEGGGILMSFAKAVIKNNLIINNSVPTGGGGIASWDGNPLIMNNVIANNKAEYAAGIVLNWSGGKVVNNIIYHNLKTEGGWLTGGLMVWDKKDGESQIVENNTIIGNYSNTTSGGVSIDKDANPVFKNNLIWGNRQGSSPQISGNVSQIKYCNTEPNIAGEGNISSFPMLQVDSFTLAAGSPCIDAGSESAEYNDKTNPAQTSKAMLPSRGGIRNDIGAYGGPGASILSKIGCKDFFIKSRIEFDDLNSGKTGTISLELINVGTDTLKIDSFYIVKKKVKLEKGIVKKLAFLEKDTFKISWSPTIAEKMTDTLKIFHSYKNMENPKLVVIAGNSKPALDVKNASLNSSEKISIAPNPCSGLSKVTFSINSVSDVKLNLIDMNGRIMKCLYNKTSLPGNYESELNASELKRGIYFLQLTTNNSNVIEKVVVK